MLKKIALVIVALIGLVLILALTKPSTFSVERRITIKAPPEKVFALVNDFHHWPEWSPWDKLDPGMKRTHSGATSGVGAVYSWDGNDKVGAGRMEITAAQAPAKVNIKLDFIRPFEGNDITVFSLQPKDQETEFVWNMSGPMPFVSKLMSVFVSMDSMIGKDFEAGLANLKAVAEK